MDLATLWSQGEAVREELSLTPRDQICVPVTLNHAMGMGFGIMAALGAGASVVLPSPAPDAESTLAALRSEGRTRNSVAATTAHAKSTSCSPSRGWRAEHGKCLRGD